MVTLVMEKIATTLRELPGGFIEAREWRYRDLPEALSRERQIIVKYPYGMEKRRTELLSKMGFKLAQNVWYEPTAIHSTIKQIWVRG